MNSKSHLKCVLCILVPFLPNCLVQAIYKKGFILLIILEAGRPKVEGLHLGRTSLLPETLKNPKTFQSLLGERGM